MARPPRFDSNRPPPIPPNHTMPPATPSSARLPTPSARQLAWHSLEAYGFVHFTVNTFTDKEWGYGDESPADFQPTDFDADQIAESAADGGLAGLILTCKHHDGFCLWPSRYTEHSVRNSPWRNGEGDVVRELSEACARRHIRFGVYLSPWDRNHPAYGFPEYIETYRNQLRELLTEYGPLFEVWFDGANGGDGYYGGARETRTIDKATYYRWHETWRLVRELQPDACIFSDAGPDIRWVGNEQGFAGDPCWATYDRAQCVPGEVNGADLTTGTRHAADWCPAECDVSIRPGWFYHAREDDHVRSPENLLDLFFRSVGRGGALNLNLPPDRRGRIHDRDAASLRQFRRRIDALFADNLANRARIQADGGPRPAPANVAPDLLVDGRRDSYWATSDDATPVNFTLTFPNPVTVSVLELREHLPLGQRIDEFTLDAASATGEWRNVLAATAVGNRRLLRFFPVTSDRFRLRITRSQAPPALAALGLYRGE